LRFKGSNIQIYFILKFRDIWFHSSRTIVSYRPDLKGQLTIGFWLAFLISDTWILEGYTYSICLPG